MLTMEGVIHTLQALLFLGPILGYFVTKRICIALQKKDREIVLHGYESGRIVRLPGGEYIEVHQPVDTYDRWKLIDVDGYEPLVVRPNDKGRIPWTENLRSSISRWFFEDRLAPLTQAEVAAADAHQHHVTSHMDETEAEEIQGAHERAGAPDAPLTVSETHVDETANTPSTVIATDPVKKPKKGSSHGEVGTPEKKSEDGE
jgi:ubiquinol-cytochrome c reductase cytochrome b subunit